MFIRYIASLIAGGSISLGLLVTLADFATSAATPPADSQPFAVFDKPQTDLTAARFDDGHQLPGGAYLQDPTPKPAPAAAIRPLIRRHGTTWWTAGPVRRVASFPFRLLRRIRCR